MRAFDITGQVFGQLTAIESTGVNRGGILWRCRCSCGAETQVTASALKRGLVRRCIACRNASGPRKSLAERFWSKVDKNGPIQPHMTTPCWTWKGARHKFGYGWLMVGSKRDGTKRAGLAHRIAWELEHGPVPPGKMVLHECDYPPCVRHLFLGDALANSRDMVAKRRHVRANTKLTSADVTAIRALCSGGTSQAQVARQFGIGPHTVCSIIHRTAWRDVT